MENTTENNKLLAEFLGVKETFQGAFEMYGVIAILDDGENEQHFYFPSELKFDSDWNWLMQIVEKIETTSYNVPEKFQTGFMKNTLKATGIIYSDYDDRKEFLGWSSYCTLGTKTLWDSTMLSEDVKRYGSKIEAVYNACIEFVKWYNENPAKEN